MTATTAARAAAMADLAEIADLYATSAGLVRRLVRRGTSASDPVVDDACQFAWSRLVHHRRSVNRDGAVGWLVATAMHEVFKLTRRDRRELSLEELEGIGGELERPDPRPLPADLVEARERLRALSALPPRQQRVMWLRGLGFSYAEMAARTGDSVRSVERQLERGRRAARAAELAAAGDPQLPVASALCRACAGAARRG